MVAYLLSELLEVGTTHRHSAARTLDSTNFTVVPSWKTSDGSTTFSLGVEAWILLQVQGLGAVDWGRYEPRRLGSTLQIFRRILLYIEQTDFILNKIPCRVDAFCACARKGLANLACRPGLTWPARACVDTIWHDQLIPIGLDHRCVHCLLRWRGVRPSLGNRRLNLKNWMPVLDMDGGPGLFPKFIAEKVGWKLNHFMRSAGTLSSWKWKKTTRRLWCEDFLIQTIRNAQEPPQQPAPKCWYCQEEGTVLPHPKTPSTRTWHLEIHETVGMLMQSFIVEDAAGHAPHAWPWNCRSTSCRWLCQNVGAFVPWWPCSPHDYAYIDRTAVDNGRVETCYIPLEEQKERWWSGTCCWTFETFAGWFFEHLAACNERSA